VGKKSFFKGALILSLSGLIVKVIGALYKIPLARLIGDEGMGLYQMAYPVYGILLTLSTAGIPVAISILVAEKQAKDDYFAAHRIFRLSLMIMTIFGSFFTLLLFISAKWLATHIFLNPGVFYGLIAVAPAIFLTAVTSAFRGYFQGNQTMVPTATSQIIEQIIRVTTVLLLAYLLLPRGLEFAAAGATFGAVTGGLAALGVLLRAYKKHRQKYKAELQPVEKAEPVGTLLRKIVTLAFPVSVGGLVVPLMQAIDATIIPTRLLLAGHSSERVTQLFGQFSGMANPLINIAPIITISISLALVPIISEAIAKNNQREVSHRVNQALWSTFLIGLPSSAGLWVLATPICAMLYDKPEVGPLVAILAPSTLLLGLYQTTRGTLQGMGKTYLPVINLTVGVIIKGTLNYVLVAIPALSIQGAGIATVTGFIVSVVLNLFYVKKYTQFKMDWKKNLVFPLISTVIMVLAVRLVYMLTNQPLGNTLGVMMAIVTGILTYGLAILAIGGVNPHDLRIIPGIGPKLAGILGKFKS
jgi:stage V sporulation protein B